MAIAIRATFTACALAAAAAAMPGCSGGSGSGGAGGGSASAGKAFVESYANIYCAAAKPCCDASGSEHDVESCKLFFVVFGIEATLAEHFDQAAADQCLAELQSALAQCGSEEPAICDRVFSGTQPAGAPCNDDGDCQLPADGDATCDFDFQTQSGKCKSIVPPAEGQSCRNDSSDTEYYQCREDPAFHCDYATDTCKKRVPIGADCSAAECTIDATCDSATNLCVAKQAVGTSCTSSSDCVQEAYCDAGGICQQRKNAGDACTDSDECVGFCDSDTGTCTGGIMLCFGST